MRSVLALLLVLAAPGFTPTSAMAQQAVDPAPAAQQPAAPAPEAASMQGKETNAQPATDAPTARVTQPPVAQEVAPPPVASERRTLKVGVLDDAPPFSTRGRFGIRTGFDVDIALAVCDRMNAACQFVAVDATDLGRALDERRVDLVAASDVRAELNGTVGQFSQPYVRLAARFVVPRDAPADLETQTRTVYGAVIGTPDADYLVKTYPQPGAVRRYDAPDEMWIDLALGRIQAALTVAATGRSEFLATPLGKDFKLAPATGASEDVRARPAALVVRRGEGELLADVNGALGALLASQEYEEILRRYLGGGLGEPPMDPAAIDKPQN